MKKQILMLILTLLPMVASAHDIAVANAQGKTIYYEWRNNKTELAVSYRGASWTSYSKEYSGEVIIPESVDYNGGTYSVTSIEYNAFMNCSGLISITIPNSVTSIGHSAFYGCSGLTSVTIPNSVTSIGGSAFAECTGLTSVTIPNSVTSIGGGVFYNCKSLTSITIPNSVTSIGNQAFSYCSNLTTIESEIEDPFVIGNIASNTNTITLIVPKGKKALYQSTSGWSSFSRILEVGEGGVVGAIIWIEGNKYVIGENNTVSLASWSKNYTGDLEIPNHITYNGCDYVVTEIGSSAFSGCSGLTSVTIPNSVTSIGNYAFSGCSALNSVTIGSGVLSIGFNIFSDHQPAKVIWLTNTPPSGYSYAAGTVNYVANDQYTSLNNITVYSFLSSIFEVDGVKYVPVSPSERTCDAIDCAYNETAEEIHIGKTVSYKGVSLSVLQVNPYAFYSNNNIKDVQLSFNGNIGYYAFSGCNGMQTLEIGNAVTDVNHYAFNGCSALESATIGNKGILGDEAFQNCSLLQTATIGEQVTSIGNYTFSGCSKLQSIIVPDAVTSIGSYAFSGCSSMTEAKIGNGVNAINQYTFNNCKALTKIQIGSNVNTIGQYAFYNCSVLPLIKIPKAVTTINNYVFSGCNGLKTVIMEEDEGEGAELQLGSNGSNPLFASCPLDSVYIGRNITYSTSSSYGYSPFYRNTSLRAVTITDKETEISVNEFYGCTNLKKVSIGESVTTIGNWAFSGCSSLDVFSFGSKVSRIGQEAFSDCTAMTKLISRATTPPTCGSQALDDISKWTCELTVPEGTLSSYQAADQWKDFFFVNEQNEEGGEDPVIPEDKKCATPTISYASGKVSFACETEGVEFVPHATPLNSTSYANGEMELPSRYRITVYATKEGYQDSDVATKEIDIQGSGTGIKGDVNQDGVVSISDAVGVVNIILNNGEPQAAPALEEPIESMEAE